MHYICETSQVPDPGCKEFTLLQMNLSGFVVHWRDAWYAYENRCPHTGIPLNWQPDQFFNLENDLLQCSMHGALFNPTDGYCLHGPCSRQSLTKLGVILQQGRIFVTLD